MLATLALAILASAAAGEPGEARPSPKLAPEQVVRAQLDALQHNNRPAPDAGIAAAFRFASPANREATGPLPRFAQIVRSPAYAPMIDHRIAGTGPIRVEGDLAVQRVTVVGADGKAYEYLFQLSKDPATGCWFTDGVVPLDDAKPKGTLT